MSGGVVLVAVALIAAASTLVCIVRLRRSGRPVPADGEHLTGAEREARWEAEASRARAERRERVRARITEREADPWTRFHAERKRQESVVRGPVRMERVEPAEMEPVRREPSYTPEASGSCYRCDGAGAGGFYSQMYGWVDSCDRHRSVDAAGPGHPWFGGEG